jgi:hypothetical protein
VEPNNKAIFQDGFGSRRLDYDPETGEPIEILAFAPEFVASAEFASAVGERVARLSRVRHTLYARVRRLDRPSADWLLLESDRVNGWRLAEILEEPTTLDISAVLALIRQLIPAVALFSRHQRDATIGTIGPERLILTPQGRLVLAEYAVAPGLEKLRYSREKLWRNYRVAVPANADASRIPPSADVFGMGVVAVSLLLGRLLTDDEFLKSLDRIAESLTETSAGNTRQLSAGFRIWISRALQCDESTAFKTTQEAQVGFEEMLAKERGYVTTPAQLELFITRYEKLAGAPPALAPRPVSQPSAPVAAAAPVVAAPAPAAAPEPPPEPPVLPPPPRPVFESPASAYGEASVYGTSLHVPPAETEEPAESPAPSGRGIPVAASARATSDASYGETSAASARGSESSYGASSRASGRGIPVATPSGRGIPVARPATAESEKSGAAASPLQRMALVAVAVIAVLEGGAIAWLMSRGGGGLSASGNGELAVQSRPVAARVSVDGEERGVTPLTTELKPGSHILEVRVGKSEPRVIPIQIKPGMQSNLYVELQSVATVGGIDVRTDPSRARVTVNGQYRGTTPLLLRDLPPGEHDLVLEGGGRQVRQTVKVEPGITSQLVVPLGR